VAGPEVRTWARVRGFGRARVAMTASVAAPAAVALDAIAATLAADGFRVEPEGAGFTASWRPRRAVLQNLLALGTLQVDGLVLDHPRLRVEATSQGGTTRVRIATVRESWAGGNQLRTARALTAAFTRLQNAGHPVTLTGWERVD
jgi:hypothetical protein